MLAAGPHAIAERIAADRRIWKEQGARGKSSAFLVIFNSRCLAHARPSPEFARLCTELASLYLTELAPVLPDVIYTEAIPLRGHDGVLRLFKGSVQLFHTGAHLRRHHDRRIPGGVMISVNGPGYYANSLVTQGICVDLSESAPMVRRLAARSIGAGGLGDERALSTTWHRDLAARDTHPLVLRRLPPRRSGPIRCRQRPPPVNRPLPRPRTMVLAALAYIDASETSLTDPTHGWFHGVPIPERDLHHNPWRPVVPIDAPDFNY
ncbi:hypothetical protein AB0F85_15020 [Nocardia fluminea]|uniref:hypothetical protein n=1 Tax=Nocardia fluminea TaxID=134984 RepID=UPI0033CF0600